LVLEELSLSKMLLQIASRRPRNHLSFLDASQ